jgi:hypothetical protein
VGHILHRSCVPCPFEKIGTWDPANEPKRTKHVADSLERVSERKHLVRSIRYTRLRRRPRSFNRASNSSIKAHGELALWIARTVAGANEMLCEEQGPVRLLRMSMGLNSRLHEGANEMLCERQGPLQRLLMSMGLNARLPDRVLGQYC